MKMSKKEYDQYVARKAPKSRLARNMARAFISGGLICCIGEAILNGYGTFLSRVDAGAATSVTLVFVGALLTGLKVYDNMARFAGAAPSHSTGSRTRLPCRGSSYPGIWT
jgi:stage V sporulation protein AC